MPVGVYKRTAEHKRNLGLSRVGRKGSLNAGRKSNFEGLMQMEARKRMNMPLTGKSYKEYLEVAAKKEEYYKVVLNNLES